MSGAILSALKGELLPDSEFCKEHAAMEPDVDVLQAIAEARASTGMTQKQLAEATGISQADISKLERGNANPSLRTLKRIAAGMGMQVHIEFRPI